MIEALTQSVDLPLWLVLTLAGYQRVLRLAGDARARRRAAADKQDDRTR